MEDKQIFLSTDLAHRLAAIDIGSNSVRLMVAEPLKGGNYRILDEERESSRLVLPQLAQVMMGTKTS